MMAGITKQDFLDFFSIFTSTKEIISFFLSIGSGFQTLPNVQINTTQYYHIEQKTSRRKTKRFLIYLMIFLFSNSLINFSTHSSTVKFTEFKTNSGFCGGS